LHLAFRAQSRRVVEEFYQIAIETGAQDNGRPGLRQHFGPNYYAAFILDFDGHNVEAVSRM